MLQIYLASDYKRTDKRSPEWHAYKQWEQNGSNGVLWNAVRLCNASVMLKSRTFILRTLCSMVFGCNIMRIASWLVILNCNK